MGLEKTYKKIQSILCYQPFSKIDSSNEQEQFETNFVEVVLCLGVGVNGGDTVFNLYQPIPASEQVKSLTRYPAVPVFG